MEQIRIVNHRPTFLGLPAAGEFPAVTLQPGGNNVPKAYWDALVCDLDHSKGPGKVFRSFLNQRWIEAVEPGPNASAEEIAKAEAAVLEPEGPKPPADLSDRSEEAALVFVQKIPDLTRETLEQWLAAETRQSVRDAIGIRLVSMAPPSPPPPPPSPPPATEPPTE